MNNLFFDSFDGPSGPIYVVMAADGIQRIFLDESHWDDFYRASRHLQHDPTKCLQAVSQLKEYLSGHRTTFTMPLNIQGTIFNKKVWAVVNSICYGQTATYSQIAQAIDSPGAARAVGQANKHNPLPIIIPCHRVIAKNGNLAGYLGNNTSMKKYLIDLENSYNNRSFAGE